MYAKHMNAKADPTGIVPNVETPVRDAIASSKQKNRTVAKAGGMATMASEIARTIAAIPIIATASRDIPQMYAIIAPTVRATPRAFARTPSADLVLLYVGALNCIIKSFDRSIQSPA